jgi:ABC-type transport system substrate-binding protein
LNRALEKYQSTLAAAQQALYAVNAESEPTLGAWKFKSQTSAAWINQVNPAFPFGKPNFERASYRFFDNEADALSAFENNEVDFILSPNGLARAVKGAKNNATSSARFLIFNPALPQFADPALRAALSCMIDREYLAREILQDQAAPLNGFIVSAQWRSPNASAPCTGMDNSRRVEYAVKLLKDAGYSWSQQPSQKSAGKRLTAPSGKAFPKITLNAPSHAADALRYAAAKYIAEQAQYLGIPFAVKEMGADEVVYAVYSSQKYDAALVGWRLSEYPGYICEWFGGRNPYLYSGKEFASQCNALGRESNLEAARKILYQLEPKLTSELPFIPLFTTTRMEAYQNLIYPAPNILNGWSGLYGAPFYAMPAP